MKRNPRGKKSGHFERCVEGVKHSGSAYDPQAVCAAQERRLGLMNPGQDGYVLDGSIFIRDRAFAKRQAKKMADDKRGPVRIQEYRDGKLGRTIATVRPGSAKTRSPLYNPAAESVEAYRDFHGREPDEFVTVEEKIHFHKYLASVGELEKLEVKAKDGGMVALSKFKGALLATNESRNQLFIRGGDQSVDVTQFGIRALHETNTLGKVLAVEYFTRKDHLGRDGGTAVYRHEFERPHPDLIYYARDQRLVFSGGDYEILPEGIDK